ncbi:MAG TPA: hypothetical protein PL085_11550 [Agriterribacter sp.]|uniref:hypothetical protein n=1 Tax=Agriterribacter sp. TaxID=2821509 RepID=UPI002B8B8308|nr:hypothetical protein [Agriterribacter sp.]HRQ17704.1 hypothetical protein [Agriterribacter sp.]
MKSGIDIVDDMYTLLNVTEVTSVITGKVYKGTRPDSSDKEDICINALAVTGRQMQTGIINVNIHAQNLKLMIGGMADNTKPNNKRLNQIFHIVEPILKDAMIYSTGTEIQMVNMIEEKDSHYLNIRVQTYSVNL